MYVCAISVSSDVTTMGIRIVVARSSWEPLESTREHRWDGSVVTLNPARGSHATSAGIGVKFPARLAGDVVTKRGWQHIMDRSVCVLDVRCAPAIEWSAVQLKERAVGEEDASGRPPGGRRHVDPAAPMVGVAVCNGRGD